MKLLFTTILSVLIGTSVTQAQPRKVWATVPFIKGADLCQYDQVFSQTRSEYMDEMVGLASELMGSGARGKEALDMLVKFNGLYDKNLALAKSGKSLEVTLENSLKSYLDQFYRTYPSRDRKIKFKHINSAKRIIDAITKDQRPGYFADDIFNELDFIAYGSYSYAPGCRGGIAVTLSLLSQNGDIRTYNALAKPNYVMSSIAAQIFEDFQRTKFPTKLKLLNKTLTLLGGPNGSVDKAYGLKSAKRACKMLGARLPKATELESISSYGDWNGGVSIGKAVWAIKEGVYHPGLRNPSPVRQPYEINAKEYHFYCVK